MHWALPPTLRSELGILNHIFNQQLQINVSGPLYCRANERKFPVSLEILHLRRTKSFSNWRINGTKWFIRDLWSCKIFYSSRLCVSHFFRWTESSSQQQLHDFWYFLFILVFARVKKKIAKQNKLNSLREVSPRQLLSQYLSPSVRYSPKHEN
jgi:hypothetical protein